MSAHSENGSQDDDGEVSRGRKGAESPADGGRTDRKLFELLVCPLTRTSLAYDGARQELISRKAHLAFPIRRGVPHMVPAEARQLDD